MMDEGNGLNFMRARFYSASVGRFLSMDQLLGGLDNTQSLDRFAYALGNPISNFDPSGMVPTKLEAAQIANDVYSPGKNTISGGWELDSGHNKYLGRDDKKSGYRGRVYRRKINESDFEYAYAYAGTTALDLGGDWKSNLDQHLGKNSDQYATAMAISSEVSAEFDSSELTFVGHSLGGGLAKVSSATTGRSAVTFNSAYVNIQTIKSHLDKGGMIYDSKITSYYTQNDILNFYYGQNHFGSNTNNIMIKTPKVKVSKWNLPHINLLIRIKSHMMGTVFENI